MVLDSYQEIIAYLSENMDAKIYLFDKVKTGISFVAAVSEKDKDKNLFIAEDVFNQYQEDFRNFFHEKIMGLGSNGPAVLNIPNMLVTEELVDFIVDSQELSATKVCFYSLATETVDKRLVKKLEQSKNYIVLNGIVISSKLESVYKRMEEADDVVFDIDKLSDSIIEAFKYFGDHTKIHLVVDEKYDDSFINNSSLSLYGYNEVEYLRKVLSILKKLSTHGKKYNVVVLVNNRELFKYSGILEMDNLNIILEDNTMEYTKEEYQLEEERLEELVKPIKEAYLSPFEKYLAVYNIVKQFKPYKENLQNVNESKFLKYILNNEYMTCLGFSDLLKVLLDKVGISSCVVSANIDNSYQGGFTLEEKVTHFKENGHARNIVKIDDDEYNIHGIFVADSTWDNNLAYDFYSHALMTFDKLKESSKLEGLKPIDLLLDFHSMDEFMEKFNYLVKVMEKPVENGESLKKEVIFYQIYLKICEFLRKLDYVKYDQLFKKYHQEMNLLLENGISEQRQQMFNKFLTEYVEYILPLVNHEIDDEKLLHGALAVKMLVNQYDQKMLEEWYLTTLKAMELRSKIIFPYLYDSENSRSNYLELKEWNEKKR